MEFAKPYIFAFSEFCGFLFLSVRHPERSDVMASLSNGDLAMNTLPVLYQWTLSETSVKKRTSLRRAGRRASSMTFRMTESEWEQAVASAIPMLLRLARRLSSDDEVAEEAVQDALLKASRRWKAFRGEAKLETWLSRIVIHAVRDRIAKKKRHTVDDRQVDELCSAQRGPQDIAIAAEERSRVQAAVARLPSRQREVLTLMTWEALTPAEVSELLDITVQNVHANLHAARKQLKQLLLPETDTD